MSAGTIARRAAKASVLPRGLLERRRAGDLAILLYHRIGAGGGEIEMPLSAFERQMIHLSERERLVSLDTALADGREGGVVVTFDDGYRDFLDLALPVLVRHKVPTVLYLATSLVAEEGGPPEESLSWAGLAEAVSTGLVTVGSHTHTHADLSGRSEEESEGEMRRSKELIEDRLGVACRHFAYPWAIGSAAAERATRRLFASAALDAWRTNRRGRVDPYRLGRTPVLRSDGQVFFRAKVAGMLDGEALLYRALGRGPWRRR